MQQLHNRFRYGGWIRAAAAAALLLIGRSGYADNLSTSAAVRANNSLLVDVQVTTGASVERVSITYQTSGVETLVSHLTQASSTGSTTITIGRLRANRTYSYTVDAFDRDGAPVGTASGSFTTGLLPAPLLTNTFLLSVRYLDTVIAISPQFDRIAWRIGRFKSDFAFPSPGDRFYHEHYVRMLENGNLLLFDNGNGLPAAEGGLYSRALELALDRQSMTAAKVWEYRHQTGASG